MWSYQFSLIQLNSPLNGVGAAEFGD